MTKPKSSTEKNRLELIDPLFQSYHGRITKLTGDGLIAEFTSVVEVVQCALEVQASMTKREVDYHDEDRIRFRMAINPGDVVQDGLRMKLTVQLMH